MSFRKEKSRSPFCLFKRGGNRLCAVLSSFFHFSGARRSLSGRSVCPAGIPWQRLRQSDPERAGPDYRGVGLRTAGVVLPRLEPSEHRFSSLSGCGSHGGLDGVSAGGGSFKKDGRIKKRPLFEGACNNICGDNWIYPPGTSFESF